MTKASTKLLIAASGTGGHLFPAIALAKELTDYEIEWLGVPNRLETKLVPQQYKLNTISVEGFQKGLSISSLLTFGKLIGSVIKVRNIISQGKFQGLITTGGYIAGPSIIAARSLGIPAILHESNAFPGKVTRFFGPWYNFVAIGFDAAAQYLPRAKTVCVGTPVRQEFLEVDIEKTLDLSIPDGVPLIVVFGGSQGAVAVNQMVRQSAPAWFEAGAWIVHLTGENDPDISSLQHPQYISLPFYQNMAALLNRANLAISRSGAGSLTEMAVCGTPAILIPYPYAAEDHQTYNARVFSAADAGIIFKQSELTAEILQNKVSELLDSPETLEMMANNARKIAVPDSAEKLANLVRELVKN
ncbi:MAG: undecaprenyldiphospho-muramoylpentapeptide beta-N-acetylglucosaminyltransferase [Mastigocoleus sp.]